MAAAAPHLFYCHDYCLKSCSPWAQTPLLPSLICLHGLDLLLNLDNGVVDRCS